MIHDTKKMGLQNTKYVQYIGSDSNIILSEPKLVVKQSTIKSGGNGVFAEEFIPKGTIFCKSNPHVNDETICRYMNDLLYQGDAKEYEKNEFDNNMINVGTIALTNEFRIDIIACFCITLIDIAKGHELSRSYGADYWFKHEFDNKFESFLSKNEYPPEYIFIDEYRPSLMYNTCKNIFCKCVNGKYYYVYGIGTHSNYYTKLDIFSSLPIFKNEIEANNYNEKHFGIYENMDKQTKEKYSKFKYLIDCSKPDFSEYKLSDPINIDSGCGIITYHATKYMKTRGDEFYDTW